MRYHNFALICDGIHSQNYETNSVKSISIKMILSRIGRHIHTAKNVIAVTFRRNMGLSAIIFQKAKDPIQQLFVDKIKEYDQKYKAAGGKMVEVSPDTEKKLDGELTRLFKQYSDGEDLTKFPTFKFTDPKLDPVNLQEKSS
ncbi:ATP synthase-coupling factor 6, mitochondrial [Nymphon striatum]|nr:ATP synthase-coupling factor 6, mitochondrial [Nymphon striatum]